MKMSIFVSKAHCPSCNHSVFELQQALLETCPYCGQQLSENDHQQQTHPTYQLTMDPQHGTLLLAKQEA
ncbi:hypothetical protein [Paenibacillus bovis]|uniref:Uncharacterized protein n=1 Tax=Paenibacillus bovis TaxID=1616788 RepID=A0A1X9T3W1_9BACL|nr:hypothetical protein [Paenibacillus bovis]ARR10665.1 hypothetical protein AR543_p0057 [Paenibacillus bovis]